LDDRRPERVADIFGVGDNTGIGRQLVKHFYSQIALAAGRGSQSPIDRQPRADMPEHGQQQLYRVSLTGSGRVVIIGAGGITRESRKRLLIGRGTRSGKLGSINGEGGATGGPPVTF